jgi:5-(carboxyamino)imidazole ribonucleotide synthase
MMIPAIKELGLEVAVLDPSPDAPCKNADHHIIAGFNDQAGYDALARVSDVITYEFEHINVDLLSMLERQGSKIYPSVESLRIIQDKLWQKEALAKQGIPVPKFVAVNSLQEVYDYYKKNQKPFFLKSRKGGYDGKGNYFVKSYDDIKIGFEKLGGKELMAEVAADFEKEVSVIATRAISGECVVYPIAENVHINSILDTTCVPAIILEKTKKQAMKIAERVMECFNGVGTFCAELFVNEKSGEVSVNEVAPRVHNTGHYTIEACRVNQFENHIRAITGLGLGSPEMLVGGAVMKNVIGGKGASGKARFVGIEDAYKTPDVNAHVYGKLEVREGRKMGHYTITGKTLAECKDKLKKIDIRVESYSSPNTDYDRQPDSVT